jgi:signal transduction histidine kinase
MRINQEINSVILISLILFLAISAFVSICSLNTLKSREIESLRRTLLAERRSQLRDVVQNAYSVLESANFYEPAQNAIRKMRFGENKQNYFFILDTEGMFWVNPARPELVGKDTPHLTDAKGRPFIKKIISQAAVKGEGFIRYEQLEPGRDRKFTKLVRYKRFTKWNWILCAGINIDDIEGIVAANNAAIESTMYTQIGQIVIIGVVALVVISLLSFRFFHRRLVAPIQQLTRAMEACVNGDFSTEVQIRSNREIKELADAVQRMQNSFSVAYRRLRRRTDAYPGASADAALERKRIYSAK